MARLHTNATFLDDLESLKVEVASIYKMNAKPLDDCPAKADVLKSTVVGVKSEPAMQGRLFWIFS